MYSLIFFQHFSKPGRKSKYKGHILEGIHVSFNVKRLSCYQNIHQGRATLIKEEI